MVSQEAKSSHTSSSDSNETRSSTTSSALKEVSYFIAKKIITASWIDWKLQLLIEEAVREIIIQSGDSTVQEYLVEAEISAPQK